MNGWEIKTILDKVKFTEKGKQQHMYKVRWADSLVTANDFIDKSIIQKFEDGLLEYEIIGPDKKSKGETLIDITNMNWFIKCKKTGEKKLISYSKLKENYPEQLLKFYEDNLAPFM
uniref:ChSh domain-containing protein n=1 Tax=Strongyloides papillosus TaxID=174720 RepID=A0A0N5B6M9_STREA